jgi:hypothetical protein
MFTLPAGRGISAGKEEFKGLFAQNEAGKKQEKFEEGGRNESKNE